MTTSWILTGKLYNKIQKDVHTVSTEADRGGPSLGVGPLSRTLGWVFTDSCVLLGKGVRILTWGVRRRSGAPDRWGGEGSFDGNFLGSGDSKGTLTKLLIETESVPQPPEHS